MPTTDELFRCLRTAHTLATLTRDPLVPSAIRLLTDAYTTALTQEADGTALTEQQALAYDFLLRMETAYLTLFGEPAKPPQHGREDTDHS